MAILDKRDFYKLLLRDRLPVAKIEFPTEQGVGSVEFFCTPLGTLLYARSGGSKLNGIKIYDRKEGEFAIQNMFCGDNLICIEEGIYVSVANKLQIQDVVGRKFLIKLEDINVVARAEFIQKHSNSVDKTTTLVYN